MGIRVLRLLLVAAVASMLPLGFAGRAGADAVGESDKAVELAQQAIAYLVNTPGRLMSADEKVGDALEAPDQRGVDRASLTAARAALERGDAHQAQALLERAIGARPHLSSVEPLPVRAVPTEPATGAQTGTRVVTDPMPGRGALSASSWVVAAGSVLVAAVGGALAWRWRPAYRVGR